jgi:hypothetical protein
MRVAVESRNSEVRASPAMGDLQKKGVVELAPLLQLPQNNVYIVR